MEAINYPFFGLEENGSSKTSVISKVKKSVTLMAQCILSKRKNI